MEIIPLSDDPSMLPLFLKNAGTSLETFRYYDKRPLSVTANHVLTLIGKEKDIPVAYGHLDREGDVVWLGICISPSYQGSGAGKTMMSWILREASRLGISKLRLGVDKGNSKARALYEKFGFVEDRTSDEIVFYDKNLFLIPCPVCDYDVSLGRKLYSKCVFTGRDLERTECPVCGLVFGPQYMLSATPEYMAAEYDELYKGYSEGDTTNYALQTFKDMMASKAGEYLNFGCGRWSKTTSILRSEGYRIRDYDPYAGPQDAQGDLSEKKFDGIFSHNVLEHVQDLVATFRMFSCLLKPEGVMAHSTPCYDYAFAMSQFHLYFLAGQSVERLCRKTGFELVVRKTYPEYKCCVFRPT